MQKAIIAVLIAASLAGCGTATTTRLNVSPYETGEFKLVDERPADRRLSYETVESYGQITNLGDDAIAPTPMQLTRTWIGKALPTRRDDVAQDKDGPADYAAARLIHPTVRR